MNKIILYTDDHGDIELSADIEKDTLWATLNQISDIFDVQKAAISKHLKNIFDSGELQDCSTVSKMETVQKEGGRSIRRNIEYYNLDVIIAVGYRVNSMKATKFRIWATKILREYLVKGYNLNNNQLTKSSESIEGLQEAIALLGSNKNPGPLKGKITFKLVKHMVSDDGDE
jgi:hypothetical protein